MSCNKILVINIYIFKLKYQYIDILSTALIGRPCVHKSRLYLQIIKFFNKMGKVRKTKPKRNKQNLAVSNIEEEEELTVDSKENAIQTIIDQLQVIIFIQVICSRICYQKLTSSFLCIIGGKY